MQQAKTCPLSGVGENFMKDQHAGFVGIAMRNDKMVTVANKKQLYFYFNLRS